MRNAARSQESHRSLPSSRSLDRDKRRAAEQWQRSRGRGIQWSPRSGEWIPSESQRACTHGPSRSIVAGKRKQRRGRGPSRTRRGLRRSSDRQPAQKTIKLNNLEKELRRRTLLGHVYNITVLHNEIAAIRAP